MLPASQIRTAINETSINDESRTVDLVWTTGAKGLRSGWDGQYYEELSLDPSAVDMSRLQSGAPLLDAHESFSTDAVIGVVERASVDGTQGTATVRFAKDARSEAIFQKVKDKILRNVSVGYSVQEYTNVSDKEDKVPTYRATRWQPAELSIVPIGFDAGAQVRKNENQENEVEVITRSNNPKELGMPNENKPSEQPIVDTEALKKDAIDAERKRSTEIRKAVRDAELQDTLADDMIDRGLDTVEAKKNIDAFKRAIEASKPATQIQSTVRVEVGVDESDKKREGIVEAVLHRVDGRNFKPSQGNPYAGLSFLRMLETFTPRKAGMSDAQLATRVMSSSDLPYILSNVMEKAAQKKYELQPRTWSRWASTQKLRNYKTHDSLRSGDFSSLLERQENGEFKRGAFSEEREQVALKDWGIIMPFTRRMLINDDLGEIAKVSAQSGVAASRLENRLVYNVLTANANMGDGIALFYADHANLGSGAAISDTSIGEAFKLMREQSSVDGLDKLNLAPKYMICGPQSEILARKYLSVISPTQATDVNVFSSSLELIIDSEITTNDYFFAADPNLCPTVVLCHLEGEEQPRVESRIDFETESVEIKVAHAANAYAADFRGLVKNANAS